MIGYEKCSHQVALCANHDKIILIPSMVEATPQGSFELSQTKYVQ